MKERRPKRKKKAADKRISLAPLGFEEALGLLLQAGAPEGQPDQDSAEGPAVEEAAPERPAS